MTTSALKLASNRRTTGYGQRRGTDHFTEDGKRTLCGKPIDALGWIVPVYPKPPEELAADRLADPRRRAFTCSRCLKAAER